MVYMTQTGNNWQVVRDIKGGVQVLFSTESFESAWSAWVSYQK